MKALLRTVFTSKVTLAVLVLCIILLSTTLDNHHPPAQGKGGNKDTTGVRSLQELVLQTHQRKDMSARSAVKTRKQNEVEESAMAKRSIGQNDGGDDQPSMVDAPSSCQHVHVHVIGVGDSLTEGVLRAKEASTKLLTSPYVDHTKKSLLDKYRIISGGDRIVSVTTQTFGFRGKSAAGVLYETDRKMFASEIDRKNLVPSGIPADLRHVFLNHQDSDSKEEVHRVVIVCSVLGGTNDLLRTKGSTVAPTLPSISTDDTMAHLIKLQHLCADYARAMAKRTVAVDSPLHVQVLLLPISLPPAMIDPSSVVHQRLLRSLDGKRNSIRATYGYCTTPETSWKAMLEHRRVVNDFITSPGRFMEALEKLAQSLRIEDGGTAVGQGDKVFARELNNEKSVAAGQSTAPTRKPIVTIVSKEAVVLDENLFPDDVAVWSDCLHLTGKGYADMGVRVAAVIQQQL
ncbi:membrane-associated protein, putative [Bodo saltans]|uniref:Membrane-associated protein, putative n=1 Tax=Bodo saltans TaxID=75058 RepID=A0A0S4KHH5_BODSA|nr:membrane-associated protein, putative [Bodo saltans]|eukprot:CUI12834.1 membrane-associated protein, putative [Bodo saltans]